MTGESIGERRRHQSGAGAPDSERPLKQTDRQAGGERERERERERDR